MGKRARARLTRRTPSIDGAPKRSRFVDSWMSWASSSRTVAFAAAIGVGTASGFSDIVTTQVLIVVGVVLIGFVIDIGFEVLRRSASVEDPLHLLSRVEAAKSRSAEYETELDVAQAEIEQAEAKDGLDEITEFLGAPQSSGRPAERILSAASAAEGLTEVFSTLGPPPHGLIEEYGDGGSGSGDDVGAGPKGKNV